MPRLSDKSRNTVKMKPTFENILSIYGDTLYLESSEKKKTNILVTNRLTVLCDHLAAPERTLEI